MKEPFAPGPGSLQLRWPTRSTATAGPWYPLLVRRPCSDIPSSSLQAGLPADLPSPGLEVSAACILSSIASPLRMQVLDCPIPYPVYASSQLGSSCSLNPRCGFAKGPIFHPRNIMGQAMSTDREMRMTCQGAPAPPWSQPHKQWATQCDIEKETQLSPRPVPRTEREKGGATSTWNRQTGT